MNGGGGRRGGVVVVVGAIRGEFPALVSERASFCYRRESESGGCKRE